MSNLAQDTQISFFLFFKVVINQISENGIRRSLYIGTDVHSVCSGFYKRLHVKKFQWLHKH